MHLKLVVAPTGALRRSVASTARVGAARLGTARMGVARSSVAGVAHVHGGVHVRPLSTTRTPHAPPRGPGVISMRAGALFAGLSAFAIALTVYGVWDYFAAFRVWPKELREPLRAAVKAQRSGKWKRSAKYYREALRVAHAMDAAKLGSDALLKTTGIAIALAGALEQQGEWQEAAHVYMDALEEVRQASADAPRPHRTPQEMMRGVALAQKIGDLAQRDDVSVPPMAHGPQTITDEACESYLAWGVEEMMRMVHTPEKGPAHLDELALPPWVSAQDLGASVEALGGFFASRHLPEYAVPLYVQAISMVLPGQQKGGTDVEPRAPDAPPRPRTTQASVADRCRAAILMNNISQALTQSDDTTTAAVERAIAWASKGLDVVCLASYRAGFLADMPRDEREWLLRFSGLDPATIGPPAAYAEVESDARLQQVRQQCLGTQFVLLYNLGMLHQMARDKPTARTLYARAMRQADRMQLRDARAQCARAIARLDGEAP